MHVTVLMSVFNRSSRVAAAIDSLLAQTYTDWDLMVVDDCSTDESPQTLAAYAARDPRITVLTNTKNEGQSASLNRAWQAARGPLMARMDDDDVSLPERFARQVEFLQGHPEVDVLGTAAEYVDQSGRSLGIVRRPESHADLAREIYHNVPVLHPTVMMRREVLDELGGYHPGLRRAQDHDLWFRAYRRFTFRNLSEPLLRYTAPGRPSWPTIREGAYVLACAGWREARPFTGGWRASWYTAACLYRRWFFA
ncbi:MAG: glycosyltransferase family 2 protein [Planctomycetales bacterium]|nr:glycosyltransferase family 2 protein [Planctomycetales bacterium]